jgi:hypothetical protein
MRMFHVAGLAAVASLAAGAALAAPTQERSFRGVITRVDTRHLTLKSERGQSMDFALGPGEVCLRGETTLAKCDAQPGEHATVAFARSGAKSAAIRVKLPAKASTVATVYVCPMHPEVVADKPGKCPKCGMALEPRKPVK